MIEQLIIEVLVEQPKKRGAKPKYATEEERLEANRASNRAYAAKHREEYRIRLRNYYEQNREHVNERNRLYRQKKKMEIADKLKELEELKSTLKS